MYCFSGNNENIKGIFVTKAIFTMFYFELRVLFPNCVTVDQYFDNQAYTLLTETCRI